MRSACAIGFGVAILLAGGLARAQQDKPNPTREGSSSSPAPCAGKFGALDTNKDGKIARAEFKGSGKAFAWIDADHNGFLSRPEATRAYLAMIGGISLAEKAHAYRAMDTNKDGKISAAEYKGPKARFARIDANHDGSITRAEAVQAFQRHVHRAMIVARLKAMDTNKDGMITAAEYKGPKPGFARLDVNHDGRIGRGELTSVFRMRMTRPQAASARLAAATTPRPVKPVLATTAPKVKVAQPAATQPVAWIQKIRNLDTNHDGKIVKAEFLKASEVRFAQLDRDKDGSITGWDVITILTELKAKNTPTAKAVGVKNATAPKPAAPKKAPTPVAAKAAQSTPVALQMFLGLDANKDGKLYEAELVKGIETWFNRVDSNHDRAVTRGEVQAMLAKQHKQVAKTPGPKKG